MSSSSTRVPYLTAADPAFDGVLQRAWDRLLARLPVLLILIGSDLSMTEALNDHGRPFHQRGTPMVLAPLTPADLADLLGLPQRTPSTATSSPAGCP